MSAQITAKSTIKDKVLDQRDRQRQDRERKEKHKRKKKLAEERQKGSDVYRIRTCALESI